METLSYKQRRILDFIRRFLEEKGYPPTIRDIVKGCDISSTSVVDYNLDILERGGYLRRDPEVSRGLELLEGAGERTRPVRVPIIGRIAAGEPIPVPTSDSWVISDSSEVLELPQEMIRGKVVYALRVKGTSMIDALIDDGDFVLMEHTSAAENGDMVAAWLKEEKEATLKRLYREGERIRLQPANREMEPIYAQPENVEIQGKVIGVIRQLA